MEEDDRANDPKVEKEEETPDEDKDEKKKAEQELPSPSPPEEDPKKLLEIQVEESMKHMPVLQLQEEDEDAFQVPIIDRSDTGSNNQDKHDDDFGTSKGRDGYEHPFVTKEAAKAEKE